MITVRRLGPGDEAVLRVLAEDEEDFGLDDGSGASPLDDLAAAEYLADPGVAHWVAEVDGEVAGHLLCIVLRRRSLPLREVLLYDVGVRRAHRRRGVGRALVEAMLEWMRGDGLGEVWVIADGEEATSFYGALGFTDGGGDLRFMERRVG